MQMKINLCIFWKHLKLYGSTQKKNDRWKTEKKEIVKILEIDKET